MLLEARAAGVLACWKSCFLSHVVSDHYLELHCGICLPSPLSKYLQLRLLQKNTSFEPSLLQDLGDALQAKVIEVLICFTVLDSKLAANINEVVIRDLAGGALWPKAEAVKWHCEVWVWRVICVNGEVRRLWCPRSAWQIACTESG